MMARWLSVCARIGPNVEVASGDNATYGPNLGWGPGVYNKTTNNHHVPKDRQALFCHLDWNWGGNAILLELGFSTKVNVTSTTHQRSGFKSHDLSLSQTWCMYVLMPLRQNSLETLLRLLTPITWKNFIPYTKTKDLKFKFRIFLMCHNVSHPFPNRLTDVIVKLIIGASSPDSQMSASHLRPEEVLFTWRNGMCALIPAGTRLLWLGFSLWDICKS